MRTKLLLSDDECRLLASCDGHRPIAHGATPEAAYLDFGGLTVRFGRRTDPAAGSIPALTVERAEPQGIEMTPVGDAEPVESVQLIRCVVAPAPAADLSRQAHVLPAVEMGGFVFCDPRAADPDSGVAADVGILMLARPLMPVAWVTPLRPGVQFLTAGPVGDGEFEGTTQFIRLS